MSVWRPLTTGILIGGLVLVMVALVASYIATHFQPTTELRLGSGIFSVHTATDSAERRQGLSGVENLKANDGLLMVFDNEDTWGIWMKDMHVPLDILWLDSSKNVVYIVTDAPPELSTSKTFTPKSPSLYVLEVPAGTVKNAAIKIGDTAAFTIEGGQ